MTRLAMLATGAAARQATGRLLVGTAGPGFTDVTAEVRRFVVEAGVAWGLPTLFCRHTSASLQENADPDVRVDLLVALDRLT